MCGLYSVTSNQEAICAWAGVMAENDRTGNLSPMPRVFRCHVRFQGLRARNTTGPFVSVAGSDAGMRGGGRELSDG